MMGEIRSEKLCVLMFLFIICLDGNKKKRKKKE